MNELVKTDALCRICGEGFSAQGGRSEQEMCRCARCSAPFHADCFGFAGGCAIFGCLSVKARFAGKAPRDWQPQGARGQEDLWSPPSLGLPEGPELVHPAVAARRLLYYWRACGQLELMTLLGQTWFSAFVLVALATGLWEGPWLMAVTMAVLLSAHLVALYGLGRLGWGLTGLPASKPGRPTLAEGLTPLARTRELSLAGSRWLLRMSLILALPALALGWMDGAVWSSFAAFCALVFPWFSVIPRWRLESPLLSSVGGPLRAISGPARTETGQPTPSPEARGSGAV